MLRVYRKAPKKEFRKLKRRQFCVKLRVPLTSMKIVRYYSRQEDHKPRPLKLKTGDWTPLDLETHVTPEEEGLFTTAARGMGLQLIPREVALAFGYDMSDPNSPACPQLSAPDPETLERIIKSVGGNRSGSRFSGVAIPRLSGQHFYLYVGHVAKISELAAATGQSPEAIRAALTDPLIFFALWCCSVMTGGVTPDWENLDDLFEGGWIRALVTSDPVELSSLSQQQSNSASLIAILARTFYGHALKGSAQHMFSVIGDDVVYVVAGAGRQHLSVGAFVNNVVAGGPHNGMWWVTTGHMSHAVYDPMIMNALCEAFRSGDPKDVMQQMAISKRPDSFWAWLRAYTGHVVRLPSGMYNTLSGGDPDTVKTISRKDD